jgi:hypothetical protein
MSNLKAHTQAKPDATGMDRTFRIRTAISWYADGQVFILSILNIPVH